MTPTQGLSKLFSGMGLVLFFVAAVAASEIAERRRVPKPKLAYAPVAQSWILGSIADQYDRERIGKDRCLRKKLMGWTIVSLALLLVGYLVCFAAMAAEKRVLAVAVLLPAVIASLIAQIYFYLTLYRIYRSCSPKNAVWMLVLSVLIQLAYPVILFCIRGKDRGFEQIRKAEVSAEGEMK